MNKIGKLEIQESEILKYQEVEDFFVNNENVILVSRNGAIDFSIVTELIKQAESKPNLYGILTKKQFENNWKLQYIGQRKAKYIRDRLRQHLIKKDIRTGAQLERVNQELKNGGDIGIKLFSVKPDELRQFYEQKLMNKIETLWNKHR
ncbi:hypothetical protein [Marinirhabdus gelatinilytica]|uniref:hypothetical protein n=1 Tax=Marinirhabdus gelatinilytica TaxID=1703343 RepID=UPI000E0FF5A7|nr:hypothetical protein [Marinirhabdus gelatinilytica]